MQMFIHSMYKCNAKLWMLYICDAKTLKTQLFLSLSFHSYTYASIQFFGLKQECIPVKCLPTAH